MATHVALLRGINVGRGNRIGMPALRAALGAAGFGNVRTYVQSGNIVLDSDLGEEPLAQRLAELITDEFELRIPVVVRSAEQLAAVAAANPLGELVTDPKRYQVSFLDRPLEPEAAARLQELAAPPEAVAIAGREIYAWHPDGVARSKLWNEMAKKGGLGGVTGTARNWTTVTTLLEMAGARQA